MAENTVKKTGMTGKYVVSGNNAECYVVIPEGETNKRYNFAQAISLEAKIDINKSSATAIGKTGEFSFATTWKGTGTMTMHYNQSIMRKMLKTFKETGNEVFFTIEVTNNSHDDILGKQSIKLNECSIDGGILTKFDSDAEYLDEEVSFTFNDWEMDEEFTNPGFMESA